MMCYLIYSTGIGVWFVLDALVLGVPGGWVLLVRVATRLISREKMLVVASGALLLMALVAFALYILIALIAANSIHSDF
jgi:hypothetical protein